MFSKGAPDVRGKRKDLVELARTIIENNQLNFIDLAREAELAGDVFLWFNPKDEQTEIRSLDAGSCESVLDKGDIRKLKGYNLSFQASSNVTTATSTELVTISKEKVEHIKLNSTSTSQYGRSTLRPAFYWFDVLDSLFEKNWLRGAQYYGNPLLAIIGVPGPYQATVKTQIEAELQRAGKSWVLPPDTDVKTPDFSLSYPIGEIVSWVFRMITIAMEIPITLLGSADASSRGSAFFATPRFELAIKPRREAWRIGLRGLFIKIFRALGELKDDETLSCKDFDFGFLPIFDRDFTDLADIVGIFRDRRLISKESARELIGLDHSDEEERMAEEPDDEPQTAEPSADPTAQLKRQTAAQKTRQEKRKSRETKLSELDDDKD